MKITRLDGKKQPYLLLIDRRDLALYRAHRWQRHTKGLIRYTGEKKGKGCVLLHRAILNLPPDLYVVFRNGNPLDVRRVNMEVITYAQQRQKKKVNPSIRTMHHGRPTGVSFCTQTKRKPNGKTYTFLLPEARQLWKHGSKLAAFILSLSSQAACP